MSLADFLDLAGAVAASREASNGAACDGAESSAPRKLMYLQVPLVERQAGGPGDPGQMGFCPGMDNELLGDWQSLDSDGCLGQIQKESGLGRWVRSQLFVGPPGTLSPAHY